MSRDLLAAGGLATRRAHNALQPVSRVPFEVITAIFRLLAYSDSPGWKICERKCDGAIGLGWIPAATHVCSQWRAYALADTFLWAFCASEMPDVEVFQTLRRRAQGKPLYLNNMRRKLFGPSSSRAHTGEPVRVPEHFSRHYDHAQSVMLALSDADVIDWVDLVSSARIPPHLHTLYLYKTGLGHLRELPTREYGPNPSLRSPSNLRHVLFRCCFVHFPPQNLVTLRLLAPFDQDWSPATPMLLDILANASRLESLWLYHWVCDESAIPSTSTLEMPSLLEMQLTANGWQKPP